MGNAYFTVDPFPLFWPEGWPRTPEHKREVSLFYNNTIGKARTELLAELRRMGGRHVVISSNLPLRQDGLPLTVRRALAGVLIEGWGLVEQASASKSVMGKSAVNPLRAALEAFEVSLGGDAAAPLESVRVLAWQEGGDGA